MEELLLQMTSDLKRKPHKRKNEVELKKSSKKNTVQLDENSMIEKFQTWIHTPAVPEKWLAKFQATEKLGSRLQHKPVLKLSNFFPVEVAEGVLCALNRVEEWSTSSASSDREGNNSTYGAGSTDHQFRASNCTHDNPYKKDFERLYEVIASLLPNKAHHAFQAGKYTEGHFIDAHDDAAYLDVCCKSATSSSGGKATVLCSRDVAMVYYLTKDWTSANGGCFVDLAGGEIVCPEFNTCILFHVPRLHRVEPVLLGHVRYSIFGWFYEKGRLYELDHYEEENDKSNQSKIKDKNAKRKKKMRIQRKP